MPLPKPLNIGQPLLYRVRGAHISHKYAYIKTPLFFVNQYIICRIKNTVGVLLCLLLNKVRMCAHVWLEERRVILVLGYKGKCAN